MTEPSGITEKKITMNDEYLNYDGMSDALKSFISAGDFVEMYIDRSSMYKIIQMIEYIGSYGSSFIVTEDPFGDYSLRLMSFEQVVNLITSALRVPRDLRVFGPTWVVGVSSYPSTNSTDDLVEMEIDDVEFKIFLAGGCSAWPLRG